MPIIDCCQKQRCKCHSSLLTLTGWSGADYEQLRKDWVLGSEEFRQELLAAASERIGPSHFGAQRQETAVQKAERLLKAELEKLGWKEESLTMVSKSHLVKVQFGQVASKGKQHESEMDRRASANGQLDVCLQFAKCKIQHPTHPTP